MYAAWIRTWVIWYRKQQFFHNHLLNKSFSCYYYLKHFTEPFLIVVFLNIGPRPASSFLSVFVLFTRQI